MSAGEGRESFDYDSDAASQYTARASLATTHLTGMQTANDITRSQSRLSSTADSFADAQSHLAVSTSTDQLGLQATPPLATSVAQTSPEEKRQTKEAHAVQATVPPAPADPIIPINAVPQQANIIDQVKSERETVQTTSRSESNETLQESNNGEKAEHQKVDMPKGPDLSHLTPEQQKILLDQCVFHLAHLCHCTHNPADAPFPRQEKLA